MSTRRRALLTAMLLAAAALTTPAGAAAAAVSRAPLDPVFKEQVASGTAITHGPIVVEGGVAPSRALRAVAPPVAFDLRDFGLLTPIRDQAPYNTCWAFATMAALESRLSFVPETWDFSEDNLVTRSGFFSTGRYDVGGNYLMAAAYLARWAGPLTEAADPYPSPSTKPVGRVKKHVQRIVLLPPRREALDNAAIKAAVMTYGAVATQMHYPAADGGVYDQATHAFYYSGVADPNHGVAIVGWDDAYSAAAFPTPPAGDGAFLVRNSWGGGWGDGGYFWVSYYDTAFARFDQSMAFGRVDAVGRYARAYGHDRLGWTRSIGLTGTADAGVAKFAGRFKATASEKVAAVSFYTIAPGAAYKVYAGPTLARLTVRGSGTIAEAGYCTVPLSPRLSVTKGKTFVVAVRLDIPDTAYPVPLEAPVAGYAAATSSPGQSYLYLSGRWRDLTAVGLDDCNVCLKAFTQN
jgi:C1A family cysteine protease